MSNVQEVRKVVFLMNGDSPCGPDGFPGTFYQHCWEIVGEDVTRMVRAFFCGFSLPRFITHTNLVLIPKKEIVKQMGDLRPISLSNFVNKIFSRLLLERISDIIPQLIFPNQIGFIREGAFRRMFYWLRRLLGI